ncbi:MAG: hypothetical protein CO163_11300 [Rhodobacterales bacterium CG_4_9_14_3_um_filter_71_31]|nr:MAG: hypothetical protein CO163_11300 [Rhodobacterales bacterium CG_4_9_14_3_um_filter_71_31]
MAGDARSGIVRFLKVALPLAALGLVAALFLVSRGDIGRGVSVSAIDFDVTDGLRLSQPRFTGVTRNGQPFVITADWALPDGPDPDRVGLGPVRGEIEMDAARRVTLTAQGGEIRPKLNTMRLEGGVAAETTDGYRLSAARADIDMKAETLAADGPVAVSGPAGDIASGSMRAARRDENFVVWFENRVRVRIDPERAK